MIKSVLNVQLKDFDLSGRIVSALNNVGIVTIEDLLEWICSSNYNWERNIPKFGLAARRDLTDVLRAQCIDLENALKTYKDLKIKYLNECAWYDGYIEHIDAEACVEIAFDVFKSLKVLTGSYSCRLLSEIVTMKCVKSEDKDMDVYVDYILKKPIGVLKDCYDITAEGVTVALESARRDIKMYEGIIRDGLRAGVSSELKQYIRENRDCVATKSTKCRHCRKNCRYAGSENTQSVEAAEEIKVLEVFSVEEIQALKDRDITTVKLLEHAVMVNPDSVRNVEGIKQVKEALETEGFRATVTEVKIKPKKFKKKKKPAVESIPLEELELAVRTYNELRRVDDGKIKTADQLSDYIGNRGPEWYKSVKGIGKKRAQEVTDAYFRVGGTTLDYFLERQSAKDNPLGVTTWIYNELARLGLKTWKDVCKRIKSEGNIGWPLQKDWRPSVTVRQELYDAIETRGGTKFDRALQEYIDSKEDKLVHD